MQCHLVLVNGIVQGVKDHSAITHPISTVIQGTFHPLVSDSVKGRHIPDVLPTLTRSTHEAPTHP